MKGNAFAGLEKVFLIAEAGVNHNGDIDTAKKLIDAAKSSGADAVKFQTYRTEEIVSRETGKAEYQSRAKEKTQYEMLKKLELTSEGFRELKRHSDKKGIEFMSTPYDLPSVRLLDDLDVKTMKIASADIINKPLIEAVAKTGKRIIIASGMASLEEIKRTVSYIKSFGERDLAVLHCTTAYPAPYDQVNMRFLETLRDELHLPVGYSDHTLGIEVAVMAASLGAKIIEKHFTLDRKMTGPDHFASLEPKDYASMAESIRNVEKAFGSGRKEATDEERKNMFFMRRSVHAAKDLKAGDIITKDNIRIQRPFDGLEPWLLDEISGRKIKKGIRANGPVTWDELS